ncbi:hypothetical protein BJA01nite_61220 [Bradyrhizobium japonicum]|nr:hypothetical protein BJ6T_08930 [Bradyrhizobium japonicum USDA 6]GEC48480.1 hypothetical protein BJA01nite_61220 [Bradyrhizobium japonicum]
MAHVEARLTKDFRPFENGSPRTRNLMGPTNVRLPKQLANHSDRYEPSGAVESIRRFRNDKPSAVIDFAAACKLRAK